MKNPITEQELDANEIVFNNNLINENNCAEHYRIDVLAVRRRLKAYQPDTMTYNVLLNESVQILFEKYYKFIENLQDDMPENDLEIYADLEGKEYEPDEN